MADAALDAPGGAQGPDPAMESDFSLRKVKVATAILLGQTFASSILPFMALGYVLVPMTRELHWSRTEFLFANSFLMWFGALTLWPMGSFTDKVGARPIVLVGTVGIALATFLLPFVHNAAWGPLPRAWQFYALFACLGIFGSSGASYSKVTTALFTQNRGKAMAIFGVEGTVARMVLPGMTTLLILYFGWRGMFTGFGVIMLLSLPVIFLFLDEAGTRGLKPSLSFKRREARADAKSKAVVIPFEGMTFREVQRDWVFWAMLIGGLVTMVIGNGMMANIPASLNDRGFSLQTIGAIDSIATLAGIPGVLLAGFLMDKAPTAKIAVPFHLITALSALLTMIVTPTMGGQPLLLTARCLFMFGFTTSLPITAYAMTRFFGLKSYAQIYGFMSAIQATCMGFAPPVFGRIYDVTHSYQLGFEAQIASSVLAAAVFMILPAYRFSANIGAMPAAAKTNGPAAKPDELATVPAE